MAETVKKPSAARRTPKATAENSATGEAKPAKIVRKTKTATSKTGAAAAPETKITKTKAEKTPARPAAKKAAAPKAVKGAGKTAEKQPAAKPVLVKSGEVLVMRSAKPTPISQEQIAQLAYHYWQQRGCQHGHDHEDWARAERELRQGAAKPLEKAS